MQSFILCECVAQPRPRSIRHTDLQLYIHDIQTESKAESRRDKETSSTNIKIRTTQRRLVRQLCNLGAVLRVNNDFPIILRFSLCLEPIGKFYHANTKMCLHLTRVCVCVLTAFLFLFLRSTSWRLLVVGQGWNQDWVSLGKG